MRFVMSFHYDMRAPFDASLCEALCRALECFIGLGALFFVPNP